MTYQNLQASVHLALWSGHQEEWELDVLLVDAVQGPGGKGKSLQRAFEGTAVQAVASVLDGATLRPSTTTKTKATI